MSFENSVNYRDLSDYGLALTTSGAVSEDMLAQAYASNYGAVISLLPQDHPKRLTQASAILASQSVEYWQAPVDWLAPTQANIDQFAWALDRLLAQRLKVHVHCALNMRVSAFCAVYLFERGLMSHDQAQALICEVWGEPLELAWQRLLADRGLKL